MLRVGILTVLVCFVILECSFLAIAACSPPPPLLTSKRSPASATENDEISFLLFDLRGGSETGNRKDKPMSTSKQNGQMKKQRSLAPQRLWKLGIEGWKFAVEKVAFKNSDSEMTNNPPKMDPKASTESEDTNIEIRKPREIPRIPHYSPLKMYSACMGIVTLWMLTGTLFYSHTNEWPLPQSFFYAVDAGMSIGFCTDVAETKLVSKAFTIFYIIMGASVVGGALALFIQDIVEGVVERERKNNRLILTKEYELLLGKEAFDELDVTHDGCLTKDEFGKLLKTTAFRSSSSKELTDEEIDVLWTKFDRVEDGVIRFEEIEGTYRGIEGLLDSLLSTNTTSPSASTIHDNRNRNPVTSKLRSFVSYLASSLTSFLGPLWESENRIYYVFLAWVLLGITWGMLDQGWDPITATHFAISALSTGGLTAPPVNSDGILPAEPAIFCGLYCLFGIPLMAITFGHFARALVSDHVAEMEQWALTKPITATHYEIAKQYLINFRETKTTKDWYSNYPMKSVFRQGRRQGNPPSWRGLRLSDFIVLQIFRQGRISVETIDILRKEFESLDRDQTGLLTLEDATNRHKGNS